MAATLVLKTSSKHKYVLSSNIPSTQSHLFLLKNAKETPGVKFALGVLSGKHTNKLFSGLMQAVLAKDDREDRGVGMQNFTYAPAWEELCHIIQIHSPRTYRALKAFLPMPNERTFRMKESRQPRFPMEIFWDGSQGAYYIIGGINGPLRVLDAEQVDDALKKANSRKAEKVWYSLLRRLRPVILTSCIP